jgi:heme-degrading monooxygenase HmoA
MIAVIFEVFPADGKRDDYFSMAADLKAELNKIEGFISVERFQSITEPGKFLSLSFWKDEGSIKQWRNVEMHRMAQKEGRRSIFDNYRLRVAEVCRDYSMTERLQAPDDSKEFHK